MRQKLSLLRALQFTKLVAKPYQNYPPPGAPAATTTASGASSDTSDLIELIKRFWLVG